MKHSSVYPGSSGASQKLLTPRFFLGIFAIAIFYTILSIYAVNYRLLLQTNFGKTPLWYKLTIDTTLLGGLFTAFSVIDGILLIITALLVGSNIMLVAKIISNLRGEKGITLTVGAGSLLGIAAAGCGACGLSILSLLGLTASALLPYHGRELSVLTIFLLLFSLVYSVSKLQKAGICRIR